MTKDMELKLLDQLIERLKRAKGGTYIGPWLDSQRAFIADCLRSDLMPEHYAMSAQDFQKYRDGIIEAARNEASIILEAAQRDLTQLQERAENLRSASINHLRTAIRQLES